MGRVCSEGLRKTCQSPFGDHATFGSEISGGNEERVMFRPIAGMVGALPGPAASSRVRVIPDADKDGLQGNIPTCSVRNWRAGVNAQSPHCKGFHDGCRLPLYTLEKGAEETESCSGSGLGPKLTSEVSATLSGRSSCKTTRVKLSPVKACNLARRTGLVAPSARTSLEQSRS